MNWPAVMDFPAIVVFCSCPNEAVALDIARKLVAEGLAACVNRLPGMLSVYRWQERVCEEFEELLLIKTTPAGYGALEMRLKALHPYEIPEIIALPVLAGASPYLAWLASMVEANAPSHSVSVNPL